jgi:RNA polymerase sigma-70 factor, ECF subfamily
VSIRVGAKRLSDEELRPLVTLASRGDAQAKRTLVEQTLPLVHGMVTKLIGRRQETDDLVQNVYARVFRSLGTFRGDAAFTTWVCTICVNVTSTFWRERKAERETEPLPLHLVRPGSSSHDVLAAREGLKQISRVLDGLSASLRSAFVLHVLEGYDVETVAAMTSSSVGATYKSIERARQAIETAAAKSAALSSYLGGSREAP